MATKPFVLEPDDPAVEQLQKMMGPKVSTLEYLPDHWVRIEGVGGAENAFAFAVENPFGVDMAIAEVIHHLKTKGATASAVLDVDTVANATSTGDTIFDGIPIGSGATEGAIVSSQILADTGTNGNEKPHVWNKAGGTKPFLTGKILGAAAAAYVGIILVHCVPMENP
jgi:hypothetical protein